MTGGAEQENQQIFMDPLRQAILHSLYIIDQLMQLSYQIPEETAITSWSVLYLPDPGHHELAQRMYCMLVPARPLDPFL